VGPIGRDQRVVKIGCLLIGVRIIIELFINIEVLLIRLAKITAPGASSSVMLFFRWIVLQRYFPAGNKTTPPPCRSAASMAACCRGVFGYAIPFSVEVPHLAKPAVQTEPPSSIFIQTKTRTEAQLPLRALICVIGTTPNSGEVGSVFGNPNRRVCHVIRRHLELKLVPFSYEEVRFNAKSTWGAVWRRIFGLSRGRAQRVRWTLHPNVFRVLN
jgi:hypothetical protein